MHLFAMVNLFKAAYALTLAIVLLNVLSLFVVVFVNPAKIPIRFRVAAVTYRFVILSGVSLALYVLFPVVY